MNFVLADCVYFTHQTVTVTFYRKYLAPRVDGRMYAHGLGSIALCEAYAMTHDKTLLQPAQLSLNHITFAQDPVGGGWRYMPKQPGDTSAFGWQLMALYLVNSQTKRDHAKGSSHFAAGDHGSSKGGRLYCTSLATMILEVYYRHAPIYQKQLDQDDFPL
jgi:hypothetical protein